MDLKSGGKRMCSCRWGGGGFVASGEVWMRDEIDWSDVVGLYVGRRRTFEK